VTRAVRGLPYVHAMGYGIVVTSSSLHGYAVMHLPISSPALRIRSLPRLQ